MKIKDLKLGHWYSIAYSNGKQSFSGLGLLVTCNPKNYPADTLQFVCEDGGMGFFGIGDVVTESPTPNKNVLTKIILGLAK